VISPALQRARRALESRSAPAWAALIGVLLTSPSLFGGLQTEDWIFRAAATDPIFSLPWRVNLWGPDGRPSDEAVRTIVYEAKRLGTLPWFTDEGFHVSLWRPLASLSHQIEFRLYPDLPALMHAQSLLFYALLIGAAGALYRRVFAASDLPAWASGLAVLAYAIDDAHGQAVGWIMNRGAVMASLFGVVSVWAFDRWRRDGFRPGAVLSGISLGLGLLCSEFALGAVGYLLALSVILDPARPVRRAIAALVWLIPLAAWAIAYRLLGHGAWGSALYVDPLHQPLAFARSTLERGTVLLLAQLGFPPSDIFIQWTGVRALAVVLASGLVLLGLLKVVWPLLRGRAVAAFWALGMLLSVVPASAAFAQDRMLLLTGIGAMGLFASLAAQIRDFDWGTPRRRRIALGLVLSLSVAHLLAAPVLLPLRTLTMWRYERELAKGRESAFGLLDYPHQELVLLNAPDAFFGTMLVLTRMARREPLPALTLCLSGTPERVEIHRNDPYTLELVPRQGFIGPGFNHIYRSPLRPMQEGTLIWFPSFQIRVDRVNQHGEPASARFRFRWPLESPRVVLAVFRAGRYERIAPPPVGGSLVIEAE
jgi:hypothetical protein